MTGRRDSGSPLGKLHKGLATHMASAFAVTLSDDDFLELMRKRRDEMLRELQAPPSWRWIKRHILRSGDEVTVTGRDLVRLLQLAGMEVPEDAEEVAFHRVPLRAFADLYAKADARHEAKLAPLAEEDEG